MQLRRNEILTGVFVLATLAILTFVLILLGAPGLFRPLATYKIYFDNAAGINLGAPVLLAGRKIGQVSKLYSPVTKQEAERALQATNAKSAADAPQPSPAPPSPPPRKFEVRIDVQVEKTAAVYKDAKARLMTLGLLGETAIDFSQGNESVGRAQDGEIFVGDRVADFSEAIAQMLDIIAPVANTRERHAQGIARHRGEFEPDHGRKFADEHGHRAVPHVRRKFDQHDSARQLALALTQARRRDQHSAVRERQYQDHVAKLPSRLGRIEKHARRSRARPQSDRQKRQRPQRHAPHTAMASHHSFDQEISRRPAAAA